MRTLILIGSGGFIGTVFRYSLTQFIQTKTVAVFPYGTLGVNLLGSLLIGFIFALSDRINIDHEWQLFFISGICGGFTTFSAFSHETFRMLQEGYLWNASLYITASVVLGLTATFAGYAILKVICN